MRRRPSNDFPYDVSMIDWGKRRIGSFLLSGIVCAGLVSCSSADGLPASLNCSTQYRPDAATMTGALSETVAVPRVEGFGPVEAQTFPAMSLGVTFVGDVPEGRVVNVVVTDRAGEVLFSTLYQFTDGHELRTAFAGEHGFTGLNYVYSDGAMLQFRCSAD